MHPNYSIKMLLLTTGILSFFGTKGQDALLLEQHHIFYLHGRIIELQGTEAVSERFGKYEYNAIIDSLKATGATVHHEVRTVETDFQAFCERTSVQINQLISNGVPPNQITIIGASKGAVMAMAISASTPHPINYILLAANNAALEEAYQWNLHGRVLGIYDPSDQIANKNYEVWIARSSNSIKFEQLEINTGLGHGFLYQPLDAWWQFSKRWLSKKD